MSVEVRIPTPLRRVTNGQEKASVIKDRLCDDSGSLRNFVNVYINGEDVRFLHGLETEINTGDEVSIVPAVAGGF